LSTYSLQVHPIFSLGNSVNHPSDISLAQFPACPTMLDTPPAVSGRVAVEWFEDTPESQARKYAFKCHRQAAPDGDGDIVYPVNALAFHPVHGTFASGGGDGTAALWDAEAKRRLKQYQKFPNSVAALAFSSDGKYLAVGVCPGFETGQEDYNGAGQTSVLIRELGENEAKGKGAK
jgi:cell cycle arrest protein BUB3